MFVKTQNITNILFVQSVGANILVLNFTTQNVERIKLCKVCRRETESLSLKYIRYLSSAAVWSQLPPGAAGPVQPVPVGRRLGRQHADTGVMNCQYWPAAALQQAEWIQ